MFVSSALAAKMYEPLLGRLLSGVRAELMSMALVSGGALQEGENWLLLDCCCGAGGFLHGMTKAHQDTCFCMGLDIDIHMLQTTRQRVPQGCVICADAAYIPLQDKAVSVATVCMALHTMPYAVALRVLHELMRVSHRLIVADYCLAERNLHMPAVSLAYILEAIVGGEHFCAYKTFIAKGALEGLLYTAGCVSQQRVIALGGAAHIVVVR